MTTTSDEKYSWGWRRTATMVCTAATVLGVVAVPAVAQAAPADSGPQKVIVIGRPGAESAVAAAVGATGGTVTRTLPIIDGVAATVPASALAALRSAAGVAAVTPDRGGQLKSVDPSLGYDPQADDGSLNLIEQSIGATTAWQKGFTGKGIDIALIDSGVSPVPGMTSGNVVNGPDLSFDSQNPSLTDMDAFGHGTHMGSIIAGRDAAQSSGAAYAADTSHFYGIAPDARLIPVKVAAADGSADVSQVIAAINWIDQNATSNGLNIKVINLSYGTTSTQDYTVDPLAYAAEQAWKHGIVVVVSGGNDGRSTKTLADPAYDPYVLAVGAADPNSTPSQADDAVTSFTNAGSTTRHVDVVAPGVHVLGLRDPGSYVDNNNPSAVVGNRFFRGSGTSQAAAVVSGSVALYLQKNPGATPDQVKAAFMNTAVSLKSGPSNVQGNGEINVAAALSAPVPRASQSFAASNGSGSLETARGDSHVQDQTGAALSGEQDIFGKAWTPKTWAAAVAKKAAWSGGTFNGSVWTGTSWASTSWTSTSWASVSWTSTSWSGLAWASVSWTSHSWTSTSWSSTSWADDSWQSTSWSSTSWSSTSWSSHSWR